ncbi:DMT family transporter [Klebsiella sp. BIGb0407]|uniref:DMT family transporter n=1 Tax=Klebsiella sp. BIGb0407 TaxID=2940603 RepID=UPI002167F123|nr:DMT family transporter [Klebsiella sp. BIGb0407]MCS3429528.1 drug/metabolite transporter (DMT)-like permease [Klebsiella sp. BIGb0407]
MSQENAGRLTANGTRQLILTILFFVIPPLFWAGNYIVGRAVRNDIPPVTLTFVRWLIALAIILPFAAPHIKRDYRRYLQHPLRIIAVSLSGIAAFSLLVYYGLHHTSGTNALLLNSCVPVLITLFSCLFFKARLNHLQIICLIVSCCGVLVIILKGDLSALFNLAFSSGDLLLLTAMSCFAFYTLWLRKLPADINKVGLLGIQVMITLIAVAPLFLREYHSDIQVNWNPITIPGVIFLGVFPSFISYLLYGCCVEAVGAARAGLSIHLIPVFGVVLSVIFLGEHIQLFHIMGISIILLGVGLANIKQKDRRS